MKLLMQPLASINVRTEALMLTKVEVWWYLVVQLGASLSSYFDQVRHVTVTGSFFNIMALKNIVLDEYTHITQTLQAERTIKSILFSPQVSVPLLQCTIGSDSSSVPGTPSKPASQNGTIVAGNTLTSIFFTHSYY